MGHRKLIFFTDHSDTISTGPVWTAYYFALVAHRAGLEAEVRLAGDAVDVFKRERTALSDSSDRLTKHMHEAVDSALFISACGGSIVKRQLTDADLQRWGAVPRELSEILTEVAEGRSELIYLG